jgi:hypothetical protein
VLYAILFVVSLLFTIGLFTYSKKMGPMGMALGVQGLITTAIGGVMMLFYYLICDRALLGKAATDMQENFIIGGMPSNPNVSKPTVSK